MVKAVSREARIKPRAKGLAGSGDAVPESAPQQSVGRGRPRAESKGQVVSCRLPAEELRAFDLLCARLDARSRSDGVRSVVRMASGFLEFSRADAGHLEGLRQDLHRIGTGVNQIALAASRGRSDLVCEQWEAVNELRRALPGLRSLLGRIVAERRRQGVALFREFVAGEGRRNG